VVWVGAAEGGDPYLGVRFGYDLGTVFSVLEYGFFRTWTVLGYGFFRTWTVLGYGLGRTWVWFFYCGLPRAS
jgi:hypothetical protein